MAIQSQPTRISEPFAGSGSKNTIPATNATPSASQAASWASGFPPECSQPISAGGCPVPRNDVNGVLNQISQDYAFRQDGGVWEWSALADYDVSRMVRGSDGKLYFSVQQSGPSMVAGAQDPTADDGTYWSRVSTDDAGVVHIAGTETVAGAKTFSSTITCSYYYGMKRDSDDSVLEITGGSATESTAGGKLLLNGVNNTADMYPAGSAVLQGGNANKFVYLLADPDGGVKTNASYMRFYDGGADIGTQDIDARLLLMGGWNGSFDGATLQLHGRTESGYEGRFYLRASTANPGQTTTPSATLMGRPDGTLTWNGQTVQTSSDERLKTPLASVPDDVLDAWEAVGWGQFQFLNAVAEKGADRARLHLGLIAQRVKEVFEKRGLDACAYGVLCHEEHEATEDEPAVDLWMVRYAEALCMEACCQRRRADRAEARLAALEERLVALEAKLNV